MAVMRDVRVTWVMMVGYQLPAVRPTAAIRHAALNHTPTLPLVLMTTNMSTGFLQKSDCGFPDFFRTKLLLFPDFSRHFVRLYVNINITKLAFKH